MLRTGGVIEVATYWMTSVQMSIRTAGRDVTEEREGITEAVSCKMNITGESQRNTCIDAFALGWNALSATSAWCKHAYLTIVERFSKTLYLVWIEAILNREVDIRSCTQIQEIERGHEV